MSVQSNPIIRLSDTDTHPFKNDNFIQQDAKTALNKLIVGFVKQVTDAESNSQLTCTDLPSRVHNTILINGKRGMGKTSFILSILYQKEFQQEDWLKDVCKLGIIDPTLIETKEHIFLNIISRIKETVDDCLKCSCRLGEHGYHDWKKSLNKLAGGLSVLDGVGSDQLKDALWDSPELILENGLANAKQGSKLECHFHEFLKESLKLLDKKVFLLVLDDIDTTLREGKAILETLRKYLTSRQLIIVMLGDIDLYATIVRQLQWERMDPKGTLYKYESISEEGKEIKEFYRSQIEHLEEQYLTKLLKPENRIKLKTVIEIKDKLMVQVDDEEPQPLSFFVRDLVETVFFPNYHSACSKHYKLPLVRHQFPYAKLYEKILLIQPTRSVIQVLKGSAEWKINCSKQTDPNKTDLTTFVEVLRQVFFTTLKKKLEPYDLLNPTNDRQLFNRLSLYMLKKNINRDSHLKLLPEYRDDDDNIAMLFLNALINAQLRPEQYLSYLIKVGYALDRFEAVRNLGQLEKFVDHAGLDSDISNVHIARRLLTTFKIDSNINKNPVFFGNLFLSKDDLEKIGCVKNLALFMSRVYNPKSGHYTFISLFNLLGLLADISSLVDITGDEERNSLLKECDLIRDFYIYGDSGDGLGFESLDAMNDTQSFDITDEMLISMSEWSKKSGKINQNLSEFDLANIWIRVAYTLDGIDSRSENKLKSYSEKLELYIAALLNAVFIHCQEKKGEKPDIKNPSTDPLTFYKKLNFYIQCDDEYTLFDYLYDCPILKRDCIDLMEDLKDIQPKSVIDFRKLSDQEKVDAIRSLAGWPTIPVSQIRKELLEYYRNVQPNINLLIRKAKGSS
jgi:hypothetical protein